MNSIFFAAGASYGFFEQNLSTDFLTQKVCDIQEWKSIINKYRSFTGPNIIIAEAETIYHIINTILKYKKNANFEEIAEVIDKISSYSMDFVPDNNLLNLFELSLLDLLGIQQKTIGIGLQQIPFLFRQIIAETILDLENHHKSPNYSLLIKKQRDFINYINQNSDGISVISTNYDDCVPQSLKGSDIKMELGISDNLHNYQVDTHDFMISRKVQYYPHGHLRFQATDNSNVTVWNDINEANERRWKGLQDFANPSTIYAQHDVFSYTFNSFITTGQTKDTSFNNLPYSLYYQRMAIDFANSNNIIIIGYSFNDRHINRLLNSFLIINPSHHLFVVDHYPYEITMTEEGHDQSNILFRIHMILGQHWFVKKDFVTGELYPFYQQDVDMLNIKGYGKIFPQITYYKKGYANFLNEFEDVINENIL